MPVRIILLIILQTLFSMTSEDVNSKKRDCCFLDFINKNLKDNSCVKALEQNAKTPRRNLLVKAKLRQPYELQDISNCNPEECIEIDDDGCTVITKKDTYYKTRCPYNYEQISKPDTVTWYPAKRNMNRGIGQFMIEEIGEHYGKIVDEYYQYTSIIRSRCMVSDSGKLIATPCEENYNKACKYKPLQNNNNNFDDLDTSHLKCLCYKDLSNCKLTTQNLCQKYLDIGNNYLNNNKDLQSIFPYKTPYYVFKNNVTTLELTFYNYNNLVATKSGRIFCMSDGFEGVLIKRLEINEEETYTSLKVTYSPQISGHYWCEAFEIKDFNKIVTNEIWVYTENIYPMIILVQYENGEDPTTSNIAYKKYILPIEKLYNLKYGNLGVIRLEIVIKWMKTIDINEHNKEVAYLIHICTNLNIDLHENYYKNLREKLPTVLSEKVYVLEYSELYSSLFCMESEIAYGSLRLTWAKTLIGNSIESEETCSDGLKVIRKCGGNYFDGGRWENVTICNWDESVESYITKNLSYVLYSNLSTTEKIDNLIEITEDVDKFKDIDVYLVSSILLKVEPEEVDLNKTTLILNNVMLINKGTLKESQSKYNATDRILYSFDLLLNTNKYSLYDLLIQTDHLISFIFDCNLTEYAGLALIRNDEEFDVLKLTRNNSLENLLLTQGLEVVSYLPNILLEYLAQENPKIIINIYLSDVLFNNDEVKSVARNFGILLDEKTGLKENITLLFKPKYNITKGTCGFWNYGFDGEDPIFGKWSISNDAEIYKDFYKCEFWHVTHFGLLILDKDFIEDTEILEIITDIECTLSLVGFFGIFTTAALFKTWRNNRGNRILLHYTFISSLQIILVYLSQVVYDKGSFSFCVLIGALLHYTLLSQFSWMLIISYLQYQRYVTVLFGPKKFILIKAFIICYFFPSIPVSFLLIFYTENYTEGNGGICYPTGQGLLFGILIPIIVIVACNILIFIRIVIELFCFRRNKCIDDIFLLRLRLVVLMFFMLGITWGLGFAAQIFESATLLYAFCSTASLQGFIIFIFFIVLNKHTRIMYSYMCKKYNYV